MATEEAEKSMLREEKSADEIIEENLVAYLKNILKHQIVPMDFMRLRKLVKEAPQNLKLYSYIKEKYPGEDFLVFLKKFPSIFLINPDKTVQSYEASFCLRPATSSDPKSGCDEVDGFDKGEYISDQEDEDDELIQSDSDS